MKLAIIIGIAGIIGFGATGTALADDVTFQATGSFLDGATLGGTLVINTGNGVVESNGLDLTIMDGDAGTPGFVLDTLGGTFFDDNAGVDNAIDIFITDSSQEGPSLDLVVDIGSATDLTGYTGGNLCYVPSGYPTGFPAGDNCGLFYSSYNTVPDPQLTGGSLGAVPEPASVLLVAGPALLLVRRRRRKHCL